jgi:2-polyprenyl-6-methoxyphenol hydroxylase-like FAD-dependent oxidoreductase
MAKNNLTAIVAGGGIGGLATSAALAQRGWSVTVYERQQELRAVGAGIYIWENGLRVLEALGAYDDAVKGAFHGRFFEQRDNKGQIIESAPIPPDKRLITVQRSQLLAALRDACLRAGVTIVTRAEVVGATPRGELHFAGGETVRADLAVGVDGIWSRVRQTLGLELLHEQTIEGALRTTIAGKPGDIAAADAGKYIENWNGERRFLVTPMNEGEIYLALTCPHTDKAASSTNVDKALWSGSFPQWKHLIERIGSHDVNWGVYSTTKAKTWSVGHGVILGDAAHAQPPNLGQGGGMAMQNGLALATALKDVSDARDIPPALEAWERRERPLVEHCQKWSQLYGEVTFLPDEIRTMTVRGAMGNPWVAAQVFRAANHIPTGTEHIPSWIERSGRAKSA